MKTNTSSANREHLMISCNRFGMTFSALIASLSLAGNGTAAELASRPTPQINDELALLQARAVCSVDDLVAYDTPMEIADIPIAGPDHLRVFEQNPESDGAHRFQNLGWVTAPMAVLRSYGFDDMEIVQSAEEANLLIEYSIADLGPIPDNTPSFAVLADEPEVCRIAISNRSGQTRILARFRYQDSLSQEVAHQRAQCLTTAVGALLGFPSLFAPPDTSLVNVPTGEPVPDTIESSRLGRVLIDGRRVGIEAAFSTQCVGFIRDAIDLRPGWTHAQLADAVAQVHARITETSVRP